MAQNKTINLGDKYADRKNPARVGTVIEVNDKTKTVMLEFADGKSRPYSRPTLSKSFKALEADVEPKQTEEKIEPVKVEKSKVSEENKKLNEQAKVAEDIINRAEAEEEAEEKKDKKQKKESKKAEPKEEKQVKEPKQKKERKSSNEVALAYTDRARKVAEAKGYTTKTYKGMPTDLAIMDGKKRMFEIYFSNTRVKVYTSSKRVPEGLEYKTVKSSFDASVPMEYPADDKKFEKFVEDILKWELAE